MDIAQLQVDESTIQIDSSVVDDFIMTERSQTALRDIDAESKPALAQKEAEEQLSQCLSSTRVKDVATDKIIKNQDDDDNISEPEEDGSQVDVCDQEAQVLQDAPEEEEIEEMPLVPAQQ